MKRRLIYFLFGVAFLVSLVGCKQQVNNTADPSSNATTESSYEAEADTTEAPTTPIEEAEEFTFLEENLGKSVDEMNALLDDELSTTEKENVYVDSNGVQYGFQNDRLTTLKYVYSDVDKGFETVRKVYNYIMASVGDERLDNVLETEKTFKDILTIEDFRSLPLTSDGAYACSSNWFYDKDGIDWELPSSDNEIVVRFWELDDKRTTTVLYVRLYDTELSMSIGFNAVPKKN